MKILVTGSSGFLGKFLCARLEEEGHLLTKLSSKTCDLTKENSLDPFKAISFDQISHLAAWTQAGDFCLFHPGEQWIINQKINTNVLSFWKDYQSHAKMICMGTSCAYSVEHPLQEEYYFEASPIDSLFTYAMTKRMLLSGLIALNRQYQMEYLYLIPSTLYGPAYHTDGRKMHFIFDLIRKILRGKLYKEPVTLWGDGYQKREIIHVKDFLQILLLIEKNQANTRFNLGSGEEHSIREFASLLCKIIEYPFENIQFDATKYVGAKSKVLSCMKWKECVPDYSLISLEKGLQETVEWFLENKNALLPDPKENAYALSP